MAFPRAVKRTPVAVGAIRVNLGDVPAQGDTPAFKKASYHIELLDETGQMVTTLSDDLRPLLTAAQLNGINNLLTMLRTKAEAETLPQEVKP